MRRPAHLKGYTFFGLGDDGHNPDSSVDLASEPGSGATDAQDAQEEKKEAPQAKSPILVNRGDSPRTLSLSTRRVSFQDRLPSGNPGASEQMSEEARAFDAALKASTLSRDPHDPSPIRESLAMSLKMSTSPDVAASGATQPGQSFRERQYRAGRE